MSSSKVKKIVLLLGILIAVLIGVNAYASDSFLNNNPEKSTISAVEKIKSAFDSSFIRSYIKK